MIEFSELETIAGGKLLRYVNKQPITTLVVDSRKTLVTEGAVFFAISGIRHDGHQYVNDLYIAGLRQFVIEREIDLAMFPEANFLLVSSSLHTLQAVAIHHRNQFKLPVIGITGSNGKTIIKEWLYQLLEGDYTIVKNPGSYNSQLGVPLSVWQIQARHTLGVFEAGISRTGEMKRLETIIRPTIGLFTNLGPAHDEGFTDPGEKLEEKLRLFENAERIIYCRDHSAAAASIHAKYGSRTLGWGTDLASDIRVKRNAQNQFTFIWNEKSYIIDLPFSETASIENASHCVVVMIYLGYEQGVIQQRIRQLKTIPMRLELKQGINHCQVIDDSYNNDLAGLQIGLDFLASLQNEKKTIILSDILQSGLDNDVLARTIAGTLKKIGVNRFIGIGPGLLAQRRTLEAVVNTQVFNDTESFLEQVKWSEFQGEAILVKGARFFQFEKIVRRLQRRIHGTVMEIDLGALVDNLNVIKSRLKPGVKLMVMVKAFAYGSGSEEVASLLQYHKVDYLGVAYADEGIELRKNRIRLPILVMNPSEGTFQPIVEHNLEPEIYSVSLLRSFAEFLNGKPCKIHLKIDTGMRRLGIEEADVKEVTELLIANNNITVASVFSHLAGADDPLHDEFTQTQVGHFMSAINQLKKVQAVQPLRHILNSSGILRFPELQFDMVRLGIGLYGIDPTEEQIHSLKPVVTLKTVISQIKKVKAGETIGYGRSGKAAKDSRIATIAIGYADGFSRAFSRGVGSVSVNGVLAPVIGNVCMDMTMVDISDIDAKEGDEVILFGKELPIRKVAASINTIPYEILTNTSERVKRIFFTESI